MSDQRQPNNMTVYNVVNSSTSKPLLDLPSLRIDDRSTSSLSHFSDKATAEETPAGLVVPSWFIKGSLSFVILMALTVQIFGHALFLSFTELLGFMFVVMISFLVLVSAYLWWISSTGNTLVLDRQRAIKTYGACCVCEVIASLSNYVVDLGVFEHSPIDIAFYSVFALSMFSIFSGAVHPKGIAAMFSHETTSFVVLTIILHYCISCLFHAMLPSLLFSQLLYCSCLFSLSFWLYVTASNIHFSLSSIQRLLRNSITATSRTTQSSYQPRKLSTISVNSSVLPRTSLTSQSSFGASVGNPDIDTLNEAHGIIGDILFQESHLTKKGKESLKHIQELLAPRVNRTANYNPSRSRINSGISDDESDTSIGVTPHMYSYKSSKNHRKSVIRNVSSQFTTTTTATGLPNVDANPSERKRSIAPRDIKSRISVADGVPSVHSRGRISSPLSFKYRNSSSAASSPLFSKQHSDASASDMEYDNRQPVARGDAELNSITENGSKRKDSAPQRRVGVSTGTQPVIFEFNGLDTTDGVETETELATPRSIQALSLANNRVSLFNPLIVPSTDYSIDIYQQNKIEVLDRVMEWDFPIFELEEVAGDHILSQMAYCLFLEAGLIDTFEIPQKQFLNYFRILEANYGSNSYHNKTHAADVLHATSYLLFEQIPDFSYEISRSSERAWIGPQRKPTGGNIASALSILEVFSCYMAAAMHDFDHPGRTNAFLVSTKSPLAVLYNDKSVLENHHAAASWDLLVSMPENNFILKLDDAELKRFRFLLIECILATDLKMHFDIVRDFKEKENTGIDWGDDIERLQIMKMVIKMADINTATKSYELHRGWTVRITEEFYQQNDEEIKLSLPSTIFMSRNEKEKLPAVQVSFIQNLVAPLFHASAEAGVIPGIIEDTHKVDKDNLEDLSDADDAVIDIDSIDEASTDLSSRKVVSIILTNLEMNFEAWKSELPQIEEVKNDGDKTDTDNDED